MSTNNLYEVWYMKPGFFRDGICGEKPNARQLSVTHTHLTDVRPPEGDRRPLEWVFAAMQGEVWSPNGEGRAAIEAKGLRHTSMSVGDVVVDPDGKVFVVAGLGFEEVRP